MGGRVVVVVTVVSTGTAVEAGGGVGVGCGASVSVVVTCGRVAGGLVIVGAVDAVGLLIDDMQPLDTTRMKSRASRPKNFPIL